MSYSGATTAQKARENLSRALAALQQDPDIPPDVLAVAQNIAQAVGALFEAERASSEPDGKASVKSALGFVSQTLALLQEVRAQHPGVQTATEAIAQTLSMLYPLSTQPSRVPPASQTAAQQGWAPPAASTPTVSGSPLGGDATLRDEPSPQPSFTPPQGAAPSTGGGGFTAPTPGASAPEGGAAAPAAQPDTGHSPAPAEQSYRGGVERESLEVNIGATTESNFFVGFSGEISEGGVFAATYNIFPKGTRMRVLVTLPGGFERTVLGVVRFVRDPMDMASESEPGMGIQFESLDHEARELILRFIRKRPPMFYDE